MRRHKSASIGSLVTSVSVSVFENIGYQFGISVYRHTTSVRDDRSHAIFLNIIVWKTTTMADGLARVLSKQDFNPDACV